MGTFHRDIDLLLLFFLGDIELLLFIMGSLFLHYFIFFVYKCILIISRSDAPMRCCSE